MKRRINIPRTSILATHTLSSLLFVLGAVFFISNQHWEWYLAVPVFFISLIVLWIPVIGALVVAIVCHLFYPSSEIELSLLALLPTISIVCIVFLYSDRVAYN